MFLRDGLPFNLIYPQAPVAVLLEQPDLHGGTINWMALATCSESVGVCLVSVWIEEQTSI